MRFGWLPRAAAVAAITMTSLTAAATIGEGAAQASPAGHAVAAISTGRAVPASA